MFAENKFNTVKVLNFKALSDSYINHGKFVSVNIKTMEKRYDNCKKSTANKNPSIRRTKQNRVGNHYQSKMLLVYIKNLS